MLTRSGRRLVLGTLTVAAMLAMLVGCQRRSSETLTPQSGPEAPLASVPSVPAPTAVNARVNEAQIRAACHPHLGPNAPTVPNVDVSERPNPGGVRFKVRFWVNADGFVTQAFSVGAAGYNAYDQEDALHYIRGLTFTVPQTDECRARQIELIGTFFETRGATGDWTTAVDLHPLYQFDPTGQRVVLAH